MLAKCGNVFLALHSSICFIGTLWCLKPCYVAIVCFQDEQKLLSVEQSPVSVQFPSSFLQGSRPSREMNGGNSRSYVQAPKRRRGTSTRSIQGKTKIVTKDVVCLPYGEGDIFAIPRGGRRAQLAELGLIGKVSLNTTWDRRAVVSEISSIFRKSFKLRDEEEIPFQYLR